MITFPLKALDFPAHDLDFPGQPEEEAPVRSVAGYSKRPILGEVVRPFAELTIEPAGDLATLEWRQDIGAWTDLGTLQPEDLLIAARSISFTPVAFGVSVFDLRFTFQDASTLIRSVTVTTGIRLRQVALNPKVGQSFLPFAGAEFATDTSQVSAAAYSVAGPAPIAKTAIAGADLVVAIREFALSIGTTGRSVLTLFVTDQSANEESIPLSIFVQ